MRKKLGLILFEIFNNHCRSNEWIFRLRNVKVKLDLLINKFNSNTFKDERNLIFNCQSYNLTSIFLESRINLYYEIFNKNLIYHGLKAIGSLLLDSTR